MRSECLAQERRCRGDAVVGSQLEVDRLAVFVDGALQVVPTTADRDTGLVHAPRSADGSSETIPALLELGHVANHPPHDRGVRHGEATIRHKLDEVTI